MESILLEGEVGTRLRDLVSGRGSPEHRTVRAGAMRHAPVQIHGPARFARSERFLPSVDRTASRLTRLPSGLLAKLPPHLVLVPQCVATSRFLLTHLFLPRDGILACYFHPTRWNEPQSITGPRAPTGDVLTRPGLLEAVLGECALLRESGRAHKFVVPLRDLLPGELFEMEELAFRANRSS